MHAMTQSRWRKAAAVAGLTGLTLLSACQDENRNPLAVVPAADLKIGLELSSANAKVGDRVALAVRTDAGSEALQGFQGYLRFSPSKLIYVGQPAGDNLVLVNDGSARRGELRVIAVDAKGLSRRPVTLVFEVKAAVYDDGLKFEFEKAARHEVEITRATVERVVSTATDLPVPEAAKLNSVQWMQRLAADEFKAEHKLHVNKPGEYLLNLKYGNVTRDAGNAINVLDVVATANVSVGAAALIDSTSKDVVIAGNVRPVNGGTGGTPRPGAVGATDGSIDVTDVVAIANEAVGTDVAVVGDLVPGRGAITGNRATINADITANRTFFKDTIYQIGDASQGTITVKSGATLTIQAGTRIEGWYGTQVYTGGIGSGQGDLVIARDGFIVAIGTVLEPIEMTCVLPTLAGPLGQPAGTRWPGCWGGLFLHGNATMNSDAGTPVNLTPSPVVTAGSITRSTGGCIQEQDEFSAIPYGGCNDADSSGVLRYVRSEYGGARFTPTKERNGVTFNAVGSHTQIEFVQSHASLDDAFEFFGGTANVKHMVATGAEDDNFDWVFGFRGQGQFLLQQSDSTNGDRCVEADNNGIDGGNADALPRSAPTIWNITCVGKKAPIRWASTTGLPATCATQLNSAGVAGQNCVNQAFEFRQNTAGTVRNAIAYRFAVGLDFDGNTAGDGGDANGLCTNLSGGTLSFRSALISLGPVPGAGLNPSVAGDPDGSDPGTSGGGTSCAGYAMTGGANLEALYIADAANAITVFNAGDANGDFLVDPLNVLAPDFRPKAGSAAASGGATPTGAFFDASATYYGAVAPASGTGSNVPWYSGWTVGYVSATGGPFAGWPQK